jgi:glycosyltransferase involved in cell wall biosynthesis
VRLAYVLERYPELTQTFVEDELRELARTGHEPEVLALQPGDGAALADAAFDPIHPARGAARVAALARTLARSPREGAAFVRGGGEPGGGTPSSPAAVARSAAGRWPPDSRRTRGLARIAAWRKAAARAEHLHAHFATEAADIAALLGALTGRPHSFTGHSTDLFADPAALRARLEAADFAVVVCDYDRREVERIAPEAGTLHVIPLGVDLEAVRRTTPYDPDGPVVAVGRLVEHKGFTDLAAIAPALGREVVIAGEGPLRAQLEGPGVELRGAVSPKEARALMERSSVLAVPSVIAADGSRDGIPMVIKEALALEVPVVASDAVGNPEVVKPEHGALFRAGDRQELAERIRVTAGREPLGRAGRVFAERHADLRRQTARLAELFRPR